MVDIGPVKQHQQKDEDNNNNNNKNNNDKNNDDGSDVIRMVVDEGVDDEFIKQQQEEKSEQQQQLLIIQPPISCGEQFRDSILRMLDHLIFQMLGIIVLLLIIADGAFFFFLLCGWQTMCRPRTDCNPRNDWYNWSIQVLNILFTYTSIISMPWRCANFLHIMKWSCPRRNNAIGCNLYGLPANNDIWFYIPLKSRLYITILLLCNCIFQFINQGTRIIYNTYELQNVPPGNIWTNVFFGASFLCAGIAAVWIGYETDRIRKQDTSNKFGLGPIDTVKEFFTNNKKQNDNNNTSNNGIRTTTTIAYDDNSNNINSNDNIVLDPTRNRNKKNNTLLAPERRSSLRLFAM